MSLVVAMIFGTDVIVVAVRRLSLNALASAADFNPVAPVPVGAKQSIVGFVDAARHGFAVVLRARIAVTASSNEDCSFSNLTYARFLPICLGTL